MPDVPAHARLLGLYDQRQPGLLMQRVKIRSGRITPAQLHALAEIALRFTPGYPLHFTTRQDIELHGVRPEDVPAVQRAIADAGLTTLGSCGDTLRNVTACPGGGLCEGSIDSGAVAESIRAAAESFPTIRALPRKFKICVSGCEHACAKPWINDLGFVAKADGTFRAIGAGSLGPRPATGIELHGGLKATEVIPFVIAALRLFEAEGDRKNRGQARLRHVRERVGDGAFLGKLNSLFREELDRGNHPEVPMQRSSHKSAQVSHVRPPLGDMAPAEVIDFARTISASGGIIRTGFEHELLLFGAQSFAIPHADAPRIITCPGTTWCKRGIADARLAARNITAALRNTDVLIAISGCPNGCAHSAVADIGLVGCIRSVDGKRVECFTIFAGGGHGKSPELAKEIRSAVPAGEVAQVVSRLADELKARGGFCT
jgi:sulfite reductase beta subunit-like hemoprotein